MSSLKNICMSHCIENNMFVNHLENDFILMCKEIHRKKFQESLHLISNRNEQKIYNFAKIYNMARMLNNLSYLKFDDT